MKAYFYSLTLVLFVLPVCFANFNISALSSPSIHGDKDIKATQNEEHYRIKKVVIDPGHGGKDGGAYHGGVKEKTVNLQLAMVHSLFHPDFFAFGPIGHPSYDVTCEPSRPAIFDAHHTTLITISPREELPISCSLVDWSIVIVIDREHVFS